MDDTSAATVTQIRRITAHLHGECGADVPRSVRDRPALEYPWGPVGRLDSVHAAASEFYQDSGFYPDKIHLRHDVWIDLLVEMNLQVLPVKGFLQADDSVLYTMKIGHPLPRNGEVLFELSSSVRG